MKKRFITSENAHQLGKLQSARSYGDREIIIMWDELTKKQKNVVENINVDVEIRTSDPSTVPDKWSGNITKMGSEVDHQAMVKMIIANPSRTDVYEMLVEDDPPEPLMLWWLGHVFSDIDYAQMLADACHYGLFKTDTDYLWGTVAFGVDSGVGKFSWPDSTQDIKDQDLFEEVLEKFDYREKELRLVWEDVRGEAKGWVDEGKVDEPEVDDGSGGDDGVGQSSLLDL
ncbi:MAG: hypothetical protein ABEH81_01200 [Halopenitus sp.]